MRCDALRLPGPPPGRHHRDLRRAGDPTDLAALEIELRLRTCRSLKEKRATIRPILDGARHRYRVAAAEVGYQDKWQRARLGFSAVGPDGHGHAHEVIMKVEQFVWSFPEVEVVDTEIVVVPWEP